MFWGLVLEPSKKYTQKVDQTFHISQAALDLKSCDQEPIQLVVEYENSNFVLATLSKKANIFQVPLDLIFKTGDQVSFRTIGNGKVHLSGYHVLEDVDSMLMNGEEESDLEEMEELEGITGKRKKGTPKGKGGKKVKLDETNEDESEEDDLSEEDDDDDDDNEDEDEDESEEDFIKKQIGKKAQKGGKGSASTTMDDDDDDDEDEDEDDEDLDIDEEEDDEDDDDELEEMDFDDSDEEEPKSKTPKSEGKKPQIPNGVSSGMKGKEKSGQKQKKDKSILGTPNKEGKTPKSETKPKKNSEGNATPQKNSAEKTPKSGKPEGSPQKKVLEGGVIAEEIKVGTGPVAKPGKMANVYYVGTLASSKKQFDSVQNGPGFKFRIGRNEVIKGWDIGLNGMKVGGKRRLTIPAHLAYGSKGSPPVIPPNSTLVFTVELKGLS